MANLHFRYGVMGSSKTADALMLAYNFRAVGREPLLAKPAADTRTDVMWSRVGIESPCTTVEKICEMNMGELDRYDCVIIDEAQFATVEQIDRLAEIADIINIPVFAYGLKNNSITGELFPGSKRLIEIADEFEEIKTICWCGATAKLTALVDDDGNMITDPSFQQDTALPGHYVPLCRKHWRQGKTKADSGPISRNL